MIKTSKQPQKLGMTIRRRREELGLSQTEVAERSGIKQSSVADIESGETRNPRKPTLKALASVLNSTLGLDWLQNDRSVPVASSLEDKLRELVREVVREELAIRDGLNLKDGIQPEETITVPNMGRLHDELEATDKNTNTNKKRKAG